MSMSVEITKDKMSAYNNGVLFYELGIEENEDLQYIVETMEETMTWDALYASRLVSYALGFPMTSEENQLRQALGWLLDGYARGRFYSQNEVLGWGQDLLIAKKDFYAVKPFEEVRPQASTEFFTQYGSNSDWATTPEDRAILPAPPFRSDNSLVAIDRDDRWVTIDNESDASGGDEQKAWVKWSTNRGFKTIDLLPLIASNPAYTRIWQMVAKYRTPEQKALQAIAQDFMGIDKILSITQVLPIVPYWVSERKYTMENTVVQYNGNVYQKINANELKSQLPPSDDEDNWIRRTAVKL